jgi:polysaccharide export outer membrane protein
MDDKRKSRFYFNLLLFILFAGMLTSCASTPSKHETLPQGVSPGESGSSKHVKALNQKITAGALAGKKDSVLDYRIGTDDLLEITVYEDEKLNRTLRVSPQGNITFPLLGILRVKDLTVVELEKKIRDLLSQKYLKDPNVNVSVKEYRSQRIIVMGAVDKPNVYSVPGQITILDLLVLAGGLREDAGSLLFLIRSASAEKGASTREEGLNSQEPRTFVIDLDELLVKGNMTLNLPLQNSDVVNIPVGGKIFVGGEVRNPGGFPLMGRRMTLSQAITLAGGIKTDAKGSETRIFRHSEKGTGKEIITVNIYNIEKGRNEDVPLKENDIIIVPKSGSKVFFSELWDFVKGRIGGIGIGTTIF